MQFENSPYWKDLKPIIDSGAMQSAINGEYRYPYRINLYPGTSCMFSCLFCGRNYDAVVKGSRPNVFSQIIEQDDGKDAYRINISGGLEPLTSPYINDICKDLHNKGFRSRMITNGFLLNDKILNKNPFVNSLDHIRVSLYGLDEEEYLATTKHKKGWTVVKNNLKNYNNRTDKTKLYLNYVLIPENFHKLDRILNYIEDIGGISNLSLREDFTFQYEIDERNRIRDTLLAFDERVTKMDMTIDYGYALQDAMQGKDSYLIKVTHEELRPKQSPQVKICVDPNGNIYAYMEAGFVDRPGALRHALGNIIGSSIEQELRKQKEIEPWPWDTQYMDAYNHLIERYIKEQIKNV
jgi:dTDP-4-amino-4,6-dideoxy-D-glucose ammonia-lyase